MTLRKLQVTKRMKQIMAGYYLMGHQAEDVAWVTSGAPVEILYSMDVYPAYPENHGALIGATKMGSHFSEFAERRGYSRDLCSYARSDLGCIFANRSPIGGLPKPKFLFACNNICNTVVKWYEVVSKIFKVPVFVLDVPFVRKDLKESYINYVEDQIYEFIQFTEKITQKKFSDENFRKTLKKSLKAVRLYSEILKMGKHKPSPITCFDAFINMAPIVCLRGTDYAISFYKEMRDEVLNRIKNNEAAVEDEKLRLLWDNIPIWYRLGWLADFFASRNVCLVADTYTNAWTSFLTRRKDVRGLAEIYTVIYLNIGIERMAEFINKLSEEYDADGIVMHSNRSCKRYSFGQYEIQKMIKIPSVVIDADMTDQRSFSEAQVETRLEAFLEMLT